MISAARRGLTATEGLRQYRAGGGSIRTSWWYEGYREAFRYEGRGRTIDELPSSYIPPNRSISMSGLDLRRRYKYTATITQRIPETGETITGKYGLSIDSLPTKGELDALLIENVTGIFGSPTIIPGADISISDRQIIEQRFPP